MKQRKYKALMLDLDGTTIPNRRDGMPSPRVIEAIKKAQKHLHVGAITGRPYYAAKPVIKALGLTGPSIASGGAEIRDTGTDKILDSKRITSHDTKNLIHFFVERKHTIFVTDDDYYSNKSDFDPNHFPKDALCVSVIDLTATQADFYLAELQKEYDVALNKIVGWKPNTNWLTITHREATKQHAIFEIGKILDIPTDAIIGVGDGYNDFPLLMACGLRVAMGNAVDELKAIADYIAPAVEDDGVTDVIEKFVL